MKLYVMRHGHSPSAIEAGVGSDSERPLSHAGKDDARRSGKYLLSRGAEPTLLLTSPLKRALETSQEAARTFARPPEVKVYEPLANRLTGEDLLRRLIEDESLPEETLLVGHQPQLGELATCLTGAYFDLKPAGLVAVEFDPSGKSRHLWSANPAEMSA